jgi:hypothetical protein
MGQIKANSEENGVELIWFAANIKVVDREVIWGYVDSGIARDAVG